MDWCSLRGIFAVLVFMAVMPVGYGASHRSCADDECGCSRSRELPALKLSGQQRRLLAGRHAAPKTAMDYYLLLPERFFSVAPAKDPGRRVSFVDLKTLSEDYLAAGFAFDCDAGGFSVVVRVFHRKGGDVVGILASEDRRDEVELLRRKARPGQLSSVTVKRPSLWQYGSRGWKRLANPLPVLSRESILDQYHNRFKADRNHADQDKFIYLEYTLPPKGHTVRVTGREDFMDSSRTCVWAKYVIF